jgi:hypothetical protein
MKHEWKKVEKQYYLPKSQPEHVYIPSFKFFTVEGKGNPNDSFFGEYISVLYSLSYAVKMSQRKNMAPPNFFDYTVYPLEGIWDLNEEGRANYQGTINKHDLIFTLMIRQPDFVTAEYAAMIIEFTKKNKPQRLLQDVKFKEINEGNCVQMLHIGSYDDEPSSFARMKTYTQSQQLTRISMTHHEIYLSDARKVTPDNLKTILRFNVDKQP